MSTHLKEEDLNLSTQVSDQSGDEDQQEQQNSIIDSSEEEEDDDDEEAIKQVRDGFIVDDDDEEDEEEVVRKKKHKRRHRERERQPTEEANDQLDEDDLELLMENSGARPQPSGSNFKRLKRAEQDIGGASTGLDDMFSDEEQSEVEAVNEKPRNVLDEFDDFIEEDEYSDEDERQEAVARKRAKKTTTTIDPTNISEGDKEKLYDLFHVFGNGEDYEWALEADEDNEGDLLDNEAPTELNDIFEHAELKEKMLTDEDNQIRILDIPERYQKYRSTLGSYTLTAEELEDEKEWVATILYIERSSTIAEFLESQFKEAVGKVIQYISSESLEVPFIWTHRRDYLLHSEVIDDGSGKPYTQVHKLLNEDDLWRIVQLDIEYHGLYEKKASLMELCKALDLEDDDLLKRDDIIRAKTMVELQDLSDYVNFNYSDKIKDSNLSKESTSKRHSKYGNYAKLKNNILYDVVKGFGITAAQFGENVSADNPQSRIHPTDDPYETPEEMIQKLCADETSLYSDTKNALAAVRRTFAEEIFYNPKIRNIIRTGLKQYGTINVKLTEKGKVKIDEHSPYADFKYAINRTAGELTEQPDLFLRMLEAELAGLIAIDIKLSYYERFFTYIFNSMKSDGFSGIAEEWNKEREIVLNMAMKRLFDMAALNMKEDLRRECERIIFFEVRNSFTDKIDQAPYTPPGFDKGTIPNVMAISCGKGNYDDAVVACFVKSSRKATNFMKFEFNPLSFKEEIKTSFVGEFLKYYDSDQAEVIAISGYNANAKKLYNTLTQIVDDHTLKVARSDDADYDTPDGKPPLIKVVWVQQETARLYEDSERAKLEYPDRSTLVRYCIGLGRYIQSPLLEYIALGENALSLSIFKHQHLIPKEKVLDAIETSLVDIVNMVGVDINEAVRDNYASMALQYVAGLGPRKASGLLQNIVSKLGSSLTNRAKLISEEITSAKIFINCSSFIKIPYSEEDSDDVEHLDATRIHPEDYELAYKMASDAQEIDEEDLQDIQQGAGIIHELIKNGVEKLDDLNLSAYGDDLEKKSHGKKRATLQMIKEELINHYEELRRKFHELDEYEIFEMLTGETTDTFKSNVVVPVSIKRISSRFLAVVTSFLIEGDVPGDKILPQNDNRRVQEVFQQGKIVQAAVTKVEYDQFKAEFSLLPADIELSLNQINFSKDKDFWDFEAEAGDKLAEENKLKSQKRSRKNINHARFQNFNSTQAEEFLAPQSIGDAVIRPSSKGDNHLAITWKVANNLFQHLDVLEIGKETEDSAPKEYQVGRKRYTDLDELLIEYVVGTARKIQDMVNYDKFREGSLSDVKDWLENYSIANPKSSTYVFCYDYSPGRAGWFLLLFKVGPSTPIRTWHVKAENDGYVLAGNSYPDMIRLCNGFKYVIRNMSKDTKSRGTSYGNVSTYGKTPLGRTPNGRTPNYGVYY